jgi:hypothetical protein
LGESIVACVLVVGRSVNTVEDVIGHLTVHATARVAEHAVELVVDLVGEYVVGHVVGCVEVVAEHGPEGMADCVAVEMIEDAPIVEMHRGDAGEGERHLVRCDPKFYRSQPLLENSVETAPL